METTENKEAFQGFVPPVDDYFRMPNEWINICADINSLAELKVVQYVLRHTWGYQDYDGVRKLTLDEFMRGRKRRDGTRIDKGTGLSDRGVKDGIALAVKHGYLVYEIDNRDKARIKKSYGIRMISELPDRKNLPPKPKSDRKNSPIPDRKNSPIPDGKNLPADRKNSPSKKEESSQRSEKDTIEKHLKIERKNHPSIPSVSFSSEEELVYELAKKKHLSYLKRDEKHKEYCATLASEGITTPEKMQSLMRFCSQRPYLTGKDLNLGNLAGELDGWLQTQQNPPESPRKSNRVLTNAEAQLLPLW
jgi:hypothetical protein